MVKGYLAEVWSLMKRLIRGEGVVAGVLSGTSGDGIDVGLTRMLVEPGGEGRARVVGCEALAFETLPFPTELRGRVRQALDGEDLGPREIALLGRDLGVLFGSSAAQVASAAGLELDLVGSHGLTLYHHDGAEGTGPASLQVGDGDHVAEAAGCTVVSDFRQRDIAAGGEGAPLSILADDAIFGGTARPTTILNLGGLANLSFLPREGAALAFDTGPAGALLDGLARRLLKEECDWDGRAAARGVLREDWLEGWLDHPFFDHAPPKSTGRDTFGERWLDSLLASAGPGARNEDLLRTAVELVACTVARGIREHLPPSPGRLFVAGGGVHNPILMGALESQLDGQVASSASIGVDPDAREALVFAVLATRTVLGEPVTCPSATGAASGRILGKISQSQR
ncbi:MAG: anhydro-N-acetylmuramic acid kinase [Candidatus Paceibacteria bacterium]|jgi:anhydro-N-acetylmuramic acid kinase